MLDTVSKAVQPGSLRTAAHVTARSLSGRLVRERTSEPFSKGAIMSEAKAPKPWNRVGFFRFVDRRITELDPPIKDMQELAALANISHASLSRWRNPNHPDRPSLESLTKLAVPLRVAKEVLFAEAGFAEPSSATVTEDRGLAMILASSLPESAKRKLLETYREDQERARMETERRLAEKIELLTDL